MKRAFKVLNWVVSIVAVVAIGGLLLREFAGYDGVSRLLPVPVIIASLAYLAVRFALPALIGRGHPVDEIPRPAQRPIAEASCGGKLGLVRFQGPFMQVSVYPDRFVLQVLWREHTIMGHEIDAVEDAQLGRLRIHHTVATTASPIYLQLAWNHPARAAIEQIPMNVGTKAEQYEQIWWDE